VIDSDDVFECHAFVSLGMNSHIKLSRLISRRKKGSR